MCWQAHIVFACGHESLIDRECDQALDLDLAIINKLACPNYQASVRTPVGYRCGIGQTYCGQSEAGATVDRAYRVRDALAGEFSRVTVQLQGIEVQMLSRRQELFLNADGASLNLTADPTFARLRAVSAPFIQERNALKARYEAAVAYIKACERQFELEQQAWSFGGQVLLYGQGAMSQKPPQQSQFMPPSSFPPPYPVNGGAPFESATSIPPAQTPTPSAPAPVKRRRRAPRVAQSAPLSQEMVSPLDESSADRRRSARNRDKKISYVEISSGISRSPSPTRSAPEEDHFSGMSSQESFDKDKAQMQPRVQSERTSENQPLSRPRRDSKFTNASSNSSTLGKMIGEWRSQRQDSGGSVFGSPTASPSGTIDSSPTQITGAGNKRRRSGMTSTPQDSVYAASPPSYLPPSTNPVISVASSREMPIAASADYAQLRRSFTGGTPILPPPIVVDGEDAALSSSSPRKRRRLVVSLPVPSPAQRKQLRKSLGVEDEESEQSGLNPLRLVSTSYEPFEISDFEFGAPFAITSEQDTVTNTENGDFAPDFSNPFTQNADANGFQTSDDQGFGDDFGLSKLQAAIAAEHAPDEESSSPLSDVDWTMLDNAVAF